MTWTEVGRGRCFQDEADGQRDHGKIRGLEVSTESLTFAVGTGPGGWVNHHWPMIYSTMSMQWDLHKSKWQDARSFKADEHVKVLEGDAPRNSMEVPRPPYSLCPVFLSHVAVPVAHMCFPESCESFYWTGKPGDKMYRWQCEPGTGLWSWGNLVGWSP